MPHSWKRMSITTFKECRKHANRMESLILALRDDDKWFYSTAIVKLNKVKLKKADVVHAVSAAYHQALRKLNKFLEEES